jgi:hypothetical protein
MDTKPDTFKLKPADKTSLANVKDSKLNIGQIFNYIKRHRVYIAESDKLSIGLNAGVNYNDIKYNDFRRYNYRSRNDSIGLQANYSLWGGSHRQREQNNLLRDNQNILRYINTYFKAIDTNIANKNTIKFYQNKLLDEQLKPKNSKGYITVQFNGKTIIQSNEIYYAEQILEYKNKIISDIDIIIAKEQLLNLVEDNYKNRLESLL